MGKPKNFYDVLCITIDQQSGKKGQTNLGCFTSRKKADEEIRKTKIITVANKADAEFVINVRINYRLLVDCRHQQLGCLLLETIRESFGLFELIRKVLESDKSDVIPCWALDSVESARCGSLDSDLSRTAVVLPERTDTEWAIVAPMIPPGRHGGRRRSVNVRMQNCL